MATSVDGELADFLKQEIATEKQNSRALPKLAGWEVKAAGSEVTLTKSAGQDKVMITLNVNHTVDSAVPDDGEGEVRKEVEVISKRLFRRQRCCLSRRSRWTLSSRAGRLSPSPAATLRTRSIPRSRATRRRKVGSSQILCAH
jgi:hypothetical protein